MVHRKPCHHRIEGAVRKWQLGGIAFAEGDVFNPGLGAALRRLFQHLGRQVERHHLTGGFCDRRTQDARTAGDVEYRSPDSLAQRRDEAVSYTHLTLPTIYSV